jgi:hypothetical protein
MRPSGLRVARPAVVDSRDGSFVWLSRGPARCRRSIVRSRPKMKQYLLTIYQPDGPPPSPEILDRVMRDVGAFMDDVRTSGAWVFNGGLHPPTTATVVRVRDGEELLTDGPFTEGKEHVGGFVVVRAADLDAALEWGRRLARATTLPIEVRPFQDEAEH